MSEEEQLGRGKRVGTKTVGGREFEDEIRNEELAREKKAKNKEAKKQEEILAAYEASDGEDEDEDEPPKSKKSKSSKHSKSSKSSGKSSKSDKKKDSAQNPDKARRKYLIKKIARTGFDGEESGAVAPKVAVAAKGPAVPKATVVAKTPARRTLPATSKQSFVETLGSPVAVLVAAKQQSERAGQTPLSARYKRELVVEKAGGQDKRPRLDTPMNQSSKSGVTGGLQETFLGSDSRAAPAHSSASPQPPKPAGASNGLTRDVERSDHKAAGDKAGGDKKPHAKGKREANSQGDEPKKAKSGDYTGTIWRNILDLTVQNLTAWLGSHSFFPDAITYDRQIRKCWKNATEQLNIPLLEYPMDGSHIICVKDRVNSFRGRSVGNMKSICEVIYLRLRKLTGRKLVKYVKNLEKNFHKKPRSAHSKGHYRHKAIAMFLHKLFFTGKRPIAVHFPDEFKVTPMPTIASICAMIQFYFAQFETGTYKEAKSEMTVIGRYYKIHLDNLETFQSAVRRRCVKTQKHLYKAAAKLAGKTVPKETKSSKSTATLIREDFGEDDDNSDSDEESDTGSNEESNTSSDEGSDEESDQSDSETGLRGRAKSPLPRRSKKRETIAPVGSSTESDSESDSSLTDSSSGTSASRLSSSDTDSVTDSDSSSDSDTSSGSESESDASSVLNSKRSKSKSTSKSKSRSKSSLKSKAASKSKSGSKSKSDSKSKSGAKSKTGSKSKSKAESRSKSKAEPESKPKSQSESKLESEPQSLPTSATKPEPTPKPRPVPKLKSSQPDTTQRSSTPPPGSNSTPNSLLTPKSNPELATSMDSASAADSSPRLDPPIGNDVATHLGRSWAGNVINSSMGTGNKDGASHATVSHTSDEVYANESTVKADVGGKKATEEVKVVMEVDTGLDGSEDVHMDGAAPTPSPALVKQDQAKPASRLTRSQAASSTVTQEALTDKLEGGNSRGAETKSGTGKKEAKWASDGAQGDQSKKRHRIRK
ncbi:hypothetical protein RhiJN_24918 [Ceratobasidium sp. AG-Ba]|nr:hypothetical protein RhiJN_24918 [Ceratobasidium sp. AG-Ba]